MIFDKDNPIFHTVLKRWGHPEDLYTGIYIVIRDMGGHQVWQSTWEDSRDLPNDEFITSLRKACSDHCIELDWSLDFWDLMDSIEEL